MIIGVDMGGINTRIGLVDEDIRLAGPCRVVLSLSFAEAPDAMAAFWRPLEDTLAPAGV